MSNGDLTTGKALETAVLVSLFTDRVKTPDFVLDDGTTDPRGWWADTYEADLIGSNLWQLQRRKKTSQTGLLREAEGYCNAALKWLLADGVAATVTATATWATPSVMRIAVRITEPTGTTHNFAYAWAWEGLA